MHKLTRTSTLIIIIRKNQEDHLVLMQYVDFRMLVLVFLVDVRVLGEHRKLATTNQICFFLSPYPLELRWRKEGGDPWPMQRTRQDSYLASTHHQKNVNQKRNKRHVVNTENQRHYYLFCFCQFCDEKQSTADSFTNIPSLIVFLT